MFYFDDKWKAFTKKATYTEKVVEYDNDTIRFQGKDNLDITDIILTNEQLKRLEVVKTIKDMGIDALTKYVMTDELPVDNPSMVEADKQARTRKAILSVIDVSTIPPETLIESGLTKEWKDTEYFTAGEPITNDSVIYKVLQSHAKQPDWTPDKAVSLFAKVLTSPVGPLPWVQPGSTNPYMIGDKVTYKGAVWTSKINVNVTVPDGDVPYNRYWTDK